jgi:hypothetical protein
MTRPFALPLARALFLLGSAGARAQDSIPAFRSLPDDALAAVGTVGFEGMRAAWQASSWHSLWKDPEVQAWVGSLRAEAEKAMETAKEEAGVDVGELWGLLEGGAALALLDADRSEDRFAVGIVAEAGSRRDRLEEIVEDLVERAVRETKSVRTEQDYGGVPVVKLLPPAESEGEEGFRFAFAGSAFLAVLSNFEEERLEDMIDLAQGKGAAKSLATSDRIRGALAKTGPGLVTIFFDLGRFIEKVVATEMPPEARKGLAAVGIGPETRVTATFSLGKEGSRAGLYLAGAKTGLLSLAHMPTDGFRTLRLVPKGVAGASAFRLGPKRLYDQVVALLGEMLPEKKGEILGGIRSFEEQLGFSIGEDLLACFGDEVGTYSVAGDPEEEEWGEEAVSPLGGLDQTGFLLALRRPDKIEGYLETILRAVGLRPTLKTEEYLGRKIHTFQFMMVPVSYAVAGDALALSSSAERVQEALRQVANPDLPSIEDDARFEKVRESLPRAAAAVSFSATEESIEQTLGMLGMFQQGFEAAVTPGPLGGEEAALGFLMRLLSDVPEADVFKRHLERDSGSAIVPDGEGVLYLVVGP